MMNLDFYRQNMKKKKGERDIVIGPKALMEKCVKQGSKPLKLGCLQIIKILFKAEMDNFSLFGYQMIITLLNDKSEEVR